MVYHTLIPFAFLLLIFTNHSLFSLLLYFVDCVTQVQKLEPNITQIYHIDQVFIAPLRRQNSESFTGESYYFTVFPLGMRLVRAFSSAHRFTTHFRQFFQILLSYCEPICCKRFILDTSFSNFPRECHCWGLE